MSTLRNIIDHSPDIIDIQASKFAGIMHACDCGCTSCQSKVQAGGPGSGPHKLEDSFSKEKPKGYPDDKSDHELLQSVKNHGSFTDYTDYLSSKKGLNSEKMWDAVDKKGLKGQEAINYIHGLLKTDAGIKRFKSYKGY